MYCVWCKMFLVRYLSTHTLDTSLLILKISHTEAAKVKGVFDVGALSGPVGNWQLSAEYQSGCFSA